MLRLSKLADYAVVVLVRLSHQAGVQTAPGIAATTGIPEPTVAKVLKILAGAELVASQRGAKGGYRLNRPLAEISVTEVISAVDGPIALTACVDGYGSTECESQGLCPMRGRWNPVNAAVQRAVAAITLADMQNSIPPMRAGPSTPPLGPPLGSAIGSSGTSETPVTPDQRAAAE